MGRYRPPAPKSSPYITGAGYQALADELQALWQRRSGVTRALTAAAAEGDRSHLVHEAADLIYHLFVLLGYREIHLVEVQAELVRRFGISGLDSRSDAMP